jgi:hypothetical protein
LPLIPEKFRSHFLSSAEAAALLADYDSAQHYLAQIAQDWENRIQQTVGNLQQKEDFRDDVLYDFENFEQQYQSHFIGTPLTIETWTTFFNEKGQLIPSPLEVKCHVFCGGIEPELRAKVWPYLLNVVDWSSSAHEKEIVLKQREVHYVEMKQSWMEILEETQGMSPAKLDNPSDGPVGDENENADVVSKLIDRRHRIGICF